MARPAREPRINCCTCCTSFITSTGLTILFLWLTLRTQQPKCFIQSLYLPSLNKTITSNHKHSINNTIIFNLKLANQNEDKGVYYDAIRLTFALFLDVNTTRPLANSTLDGFYQGHGKTAEKWSSAEARGGGGGVNRTVQGSVFLRVEFVTRVKYKILFVYTKRHRLSGGANVEVNVSSGQKVNPKGIRLGNDPVRVGSEAAPVCGLWVALSGTFVSLLVFSAFT